MGVVLALVTVVLLSLLSNPVPVAGQTGTQAKALYTQLFVTDAYNSKIRPANDQSVPTEVSINFNLIAINEVNTVQETLKTTAYLQIKWTDEFLQWTPASYGNLSEYHWPQNDVWKPDIALKNSYSDFEDLGSLALILYNRYDGTIVWSPFEVFTSTCSMDVSKFPFDKQTCDIKFLSWGYRKTEVTLTGGSRPFALGEYEGNPLWSIDSTSWWSEADDEDVTIIFRITLKRNPEYVVLTVMLPLIALAVLNLFVFVLPCDCGEKVSYAVTVFLSFAVFFSLISSSLPETIAIMSVYLICMTLSSCVTCVIAITQVRLFGLDETDRKVPKFLVFIVKLVNCKLCGEAEQNNRIDTLDGTKLRPVGKSLQSINDVDGERANHAKDSPSQREDTITWKEAINATDKILFYATAFYAILCTIITFGLSAS